MYCRRLPIDHALVTLVQLYLLHPRGYHNSNHLRNPLLLYEGSEFKTIKG